MRVFAIGDLHLEGGTGKTMDRFGENWRNHDQKIFASWDQIGRDDDLLLVVGDSSWAMRIEEAQPDLERIGRMRGTKLLFKGNHDYWWQSSAKMARVLDPSIKIIQGNSIIINRIAVAGTRGWVCPNDSWFKPEDEKIYEREVQRLKMALDTLKGHEADFDSLIVALHYPPTNELHEPSGFTNLIDQHHADACVYGHLHGESIKTAVTGWRGKTYYYLVSADAVDFAPAEIDLSRKNV
jgi:predicted phosphohydrolase